VVRILGDRDICVGAGMCALTAPDLFEQDEEDGLVVVRNVHVEGQALELARKALDLCPSGALSLLEDDAAGGP
jgi:ferredoxin